MSNPTTKTAEIIERVGLIPVLRARNAAQAHSVVQAMIAGGVTVVEVTMTVPGAIDVLKELKQKYGSQLLLGSGTVTTASEAQAPPKRASIQQWESVEHYNSYRKSAAFVDARKIGEKYAKFRTFAIEGMPQ